MSQRTITIDEVTVPRFFYGTAWKEDNTQRLVEAALRHGFRGIDTANQRRHYFEAGVGAALATSGIPRKDLFLQTKFTFQRGQDERLPYDPNASIAVQVVQSFASSLEHLGVKTIDSYLLHGPTRGVGLDHADWEAWRVMEALYECGQARFIGVSNFSLEQLQLLCREAMVQPRFVQNRCYASTAWDRRVRQFCASQGIIYQGFSLLTANRDTLARPEIARIALRHGRTVSQIVFRFALEVDMIALTGTTSAEHMRADLDVFDFRLETNEVELIESLALS